MGGGNRNQGMGGGNRGPRRGDRRDDRPKDDMEQRILEIARVTRVMAGGKRMNFRACVAIGDKKGNVGVGLGKGADVTMALNKAGNRARKTLVNVPMIKETIPHEVNLKMGAARLMLKPAKKGRGVIAGGVTRIILELAGVKNVTSKALGSKNKINNARCTIEALRSLHRAEVKEEVKKDETKEAKK
jgi:small subunit ribosomal protein S5